MDETRKFDLEDRLIDFAVIIIGIADKLPNSKAANHLSGQIVRSGTSPALNYGEAQAAESRKDFIHKMKICLKELREILICLKIIDKSGISGQESTMQLANEENRQLIAIFMKSISTAESNIKK